MINSDIVDTAEDCLEDCKSTKGCKWFSFANFAESEKSICFIYRDCATLEVDESCTSCVSGEQRCQSGTDTTTSATTSSTSASTTTTPQSSGEFLFSATEYISFKHKAAEFILKIQINLSKMLRKT